MANRTIQLLGQGYGSSPAQITVTANGNTVFSGTVNTVDQPLPIQPNPDLILTNILCTFEIDQAFSGQMPMTCSVSSGTVIFTEINGNYVGVPNPVYTFEQLLILNNPDTPQADLVAIYTQVASPPLSQQDIDTLLDPASTQAQKNAVLDAHNCLVFISTGPSGYGPIDSSDPRISVIIDGIVQTPDRTDLPGVWWWTITTGSSLAYQLDVDPAVV